MRWCLVLAFLSGLSGCQSKPESVVLTPEEQLHALLDPPEEEVVGRGKCSSAQSFPPVRLRARGTENVQSATIDVGGVGTTAAGAFLGLLRSASRTEALVAHIDTQGRMQQAPLSVVHGAVELPEIAVSGPHSFVLLSDNEATHQRLRLARVDWTPRQPSVTWGPEVSTTRDESMAYSVAVTTEGAAGRGLLVWDDFRKSASRSAIMILPFVSGSLKSETAPRMVSPVEQDAASPRLVVHQKNFYLTWLRYAALEATRSDGGLVEDPPAQLYVQRLNALGQPQGAPLAVSDARRSILAYDVAVQRDGLLVAFRDGVPGHALGSDTISLLRIGWDGAVARGEVGHELLGPGAPVLLTAGDEPAWLSARGDDDQFLIGKMNGLAVDWGPESELARRIPLARRGDRLIVVTPDGLDLVLSEFRCLFDQ